MSTQIKKAPKTKASDIFFLALVTFLLILIEPILLNLLNMYGFGMAIALRAICIVAWSFGVMGIIKTTKKECNFDLFEKGDAPSLVQWICVSIVTAAAVAYLIWNKFYIIEGNITSLTSVKNAVGFSSMILVNAFKAVVLTLFVALIQKGSSLAFKAGKWIPLGGIVLGLIWVVMLLLSSVELMGTESGFNWTVTLYQFAYGLIYGVIFVAIGNKAKYAFPFVLLVTLLIFIS